MSLPDLTAKLAAQLMAKSHEIFTAAAFALLSVAAQAQLGAMAQPMPTADGIPAHQGMQTMDMDKAKDMGKDMAKDMGKGKGHGMDMKSMMTSMNETMGQMKSSGNIDIDFARMMRMHHQAAVTMAEAELKSGKDPQMRVMAKDIIYAQKKEIAMLDKFLAKRGVSDMRMSSPAMPMAQ